MGAVILIQRLFRKRQARREYLKHLDTKMFDKRQKEMDKVNSKEFAAKKAEAARTILKHWRKYKNGDAKFNFGSIVKIAQKVETGSVSGTVTLEKEVPCGLCKDKTAIRFCDQCPKDDMQMFCIQCFKEFHSRGARKRHMRQRIIYKGQPYDANMSVMTSGTAKTD